MINECQLPDGGIKKVSGFAVKEKGTVLPPGCDAKKAYECIRRAGGVASFNCRCGENGTVTVSSPQNK